ncbi:hypothetical protein M9H77_07279 [Catharanthus roseus]|uniref:Uncharacterized protein n=1 Tax=Catharanthus roseus TaxID=4058 RepID=A0ACC0BUN2_CATRO|nr:hypothetical protein M9H77_07279 [Catharanthus roseus]
MIFSVDVSVAVYFSLTVQLPVGISARQLRGCTIDRRALVLLQIWAWSYIPVLQLQLLRQVQDYPLAPLGAMWDGAVLAVEDLSSSRDDYIIWYRDITRVYIGNPANRGTHDIATGVIEGPRSYPTQIASFAKKFQIIIRRCMISISGNLGCTPSQHDIQQTFRVQPSHRRPGNPYPSVVLVKLREGLSRLPGGARGGRPSVPPNPSRGGNADPGRGEERNLDRASFSLGLTPPAQSHPGGLRTSYATPPLGLGFSSFRSPQPLGLGFSLFQAPPPPGTVSSSFQAPSLPGTVSSSFHAPPPPETAGSSIPHIPISYASSSDSEERTDDATLAQQLGFGHRVRRKTTKFTPSDWP